MRRSLSIALGAMVLALVIPSAALAHNGNDGHHRHGHHHKFHPRHHKGHVVHIGGGAKGTPPVAPPVTPQNAGTVASYTNSVLTLTLADGSTVSGAVTSDTRIRCISTTPPPVRTEGEERHHGSSEPPCDSSSLVTGAVVRGAKLRIGPSGSEFESVWLVK